MEDAIKRLSSLSAGGLENDWTNGVVDPMEVLEWFEVHRSTLSEDLRNKLVRLPIFPSAESLHSLKDLRLPGGFDDQMKLAELVNTTKMSSRVKLLLEELGVKKLTFKDYVKNYVPKAFTENSSLVQERRGLLKLLERHIGELKGYDHNNQIREALATVWIVECTDGVFRQPNNVYFRNNEVAPVLGNKASYALIPDSSEARYDLYNWLGVRSTPHIPDIIDVIERTVETGPTSESRAVVDTMLKVLGSRWSDLEDSDKHYCGVLKTKHWLPTDHDTSSWFRPDELYLTVNRSLFASQGKFLYTTREIQRTSRDFLAWLGVRRKPRVFDLVNHLLWCSKRKEPPVSQIYERLSKESISLGDLRRLKDSACLWAEDRYVRPEDVCFGPHQFGRFRVQLDSEVGRYRRLLEELGVREQPDSDDAIKVLKDLDRCSEGHILSPNDRKVANRCWIMLSQAIDSDGLSRATLKRELEHYRCIPNNNYVLYYPSQICFADRPELVEKFRDYIGVQSIDRPEKAWVAMEASGVQRVSQVIRGDVSEALNGQEDKSTVNRVTDRSRLMGTILEAASITFISGEYLSMLETLQFLRVDEVKVRWILEAFDLKRASGPAAVPAHWDDSEQVIYFTHQPSNSRPWSAISRELALAFGFGENIASVSPGLKIVLEASSYRDAEEELANLGIGSIEVLDDGHVESTVTTELGIDSSRTDGEDDSYDTESDTYGPSGMSDDHKNVSAPVTHRNPPTMLLPQKAGIEPFARLLFGRNSDPVPDVSDHPVIFPHGGSQTAETARDDTKYPTQMGPSGSQKSKVVTRWEPTVVSKDLSDKFKAMMHADYGKRCQVCGTTFKMYNTELQTFVVHLVKPSTDDRTNNLGNLMALCGLHYALVLYGGWRWLDPATEDMFDSTGGREPWGQWRDFVLNARGTGAEKVDADGNTYIALPIRFWNIYEGWNSEPGPVDEVARYCIPHWEYLRELLKV